MNRSNTDKVIFYIAVSVVALLGAFGLGLISGSTKNGIYQFLSNIKSDVHEGVAESPNLLKPIHFLQPARYKGTGVTVNKKGNDRSLVLLSGFFNDNNELRLIHRNGDILASWVVKFSEIFPDTSHLKNPPATDWNIDIHGALALPDGSVVFNFEYGGLVKLDRCGEIAWKLSKPTHHSIDSTEDGSFWVPGRNYYAEGAVSPFPPYSPPFSEDTIMKVSHDGRVIFELSVPGLFYANDLESLLTSTGETIHPKDKWDEELVHLNKIAELKNKIANEFPLFKAGDLLISLREFNMILVVGPDTKNIKWWRIGPWIRQHDPEFVADGKMLIFNNNIYRSAFGHNKWGVSGLDVPRISNIMEFDFGTNDHRVVYGEKSDQSLLSIERGKIESTETGGFLITEFEGGRVLEVDRGGEIVWEYINRYDNNLVSEISEAHIYPESYFEVADWSCSINTAN